MRRHRIGILTLAAVLAASPALATDVIFYAAHSDDFTIGMAGAANEFKTRYGYNVYLVIMTSVNNRTILATMNGARTAARSKGDVIQTANGGSDDDGLAQACPWATHPYPAWFASRGIPKTPVPTEHSAFTSSAGTHGFGFTMEKLDQALRETDIAAASQVGVDAVFVANMGYGHDESEAFKGTAPSSSVYPFNSCGYQSFKSKMKEVIKVMEGRFPGAAHKVVARNDPNNSNWINPVHDAVSEAAMELKASNVISDVKQYKIYTYYTDPGTYAQQAALTGPRHLACTAGTTPSCTIMPLKPASNPTYDFQVPKKAALKHHAVYQPDVGQFAVGYHYVPDLMDSAADDVYEYVLAAETSPTRGACTQ